MIMNLNALDVVLDEIFERILVSKIANSIRCLPPLKLLRLLSNATYTLSLSIPISPPPLSPISNWGCFLSLKVAYLGA